MNNEKKSIGCMNVVWLVLGIFAAVGLIVGGLASMAEAEKEPENQAERQAERDAKEKRVTQYRDESQAREYAEQVINKRLKNPAGAKFSDLKAVSLVKDVWVVRGTVDATNSFNAVIRSNFQVVFKINRSGERPVWEVTSVEMN